MAPKTAARMIAEETCAKFPDAPNLQLARKLRDAEPNVYPSVEYARGIIRLIRGVTGKKNRKQATQPRKPGKAGKKLKCPPSFAEPWTKFELDDDGLVGVISDAHIPYHVELALDSAILYLKKSKIKTLVLNGDTCDFYSISRWQRDPRRRRFSEELKSIISFLDWIRQEMPKVRIIWKDGNHEERWQHFIWNRAPEIYDLPSCTIPSLLHFDDYGIEYVTEQRPIMLGKLPLLHGHEYGAQALFSPVNPASVSYTNGTPRHQAPIKNPGFFGLFPKSVHQSFGHQIESKIA